MKRRKLVVSADSAVTDLPDQTIWNIAQSTAQRLRIINELDVPAPTKAESGREALQRVTATATALGEGHIASVYVERARRTAVHWARWRASRR